MMAQVIKVDLTDSTDENCPFRFNTFGCRAVGLLLGHGYVGVCNGDWDDAPDDCPLRKGPVIVEAQ